MKSKRDGLESVEDCRQYQRDFIDWLSVNGDQFIVRPLKPKATVRAVSLRFQRMSSALHIKIRPNSIVVYVSWNEECFDFLLDLDMAPVRKGNAYRCKLCEQSEVTFPDLLAMRLDHLYEPFLKWCNEQLLISRWLEIQIGRGYGGAKLLPNFDDSKLSVVVMEKHDDRPKCGQDEHHVFYLPVFDAPDRWLIAQTWLNSFKNGFWRFKPRG